MPTGNVDTTRVGALFNDAAEAAASSLLENLAAGFVGEGTDPVEFVPGDSAVAVACRMHGLEGTMVLAMSAAMVAEVLNGPYGGQGVVAAVEPGLRAASVIFEDGDRAMTNWRNLTCW